MQFDSLQSLIAMNGYGAYVWSSYLVFLVVIAALVLGTRLQYRRIVLDQQRLARIETRKASERKTQNESGS
jgi:heme exporter protein D